MVTVHTFEVTANKFDTESIISSKFFLQR